MVDLGSRVRGGRVDERETRVWEPWTADSKKTREGGKLVGFAPGGPRACEANYKPPTHQKSRTRSMMPQDDFFIFIFIFSTIFKNI